MGKKNIMEEVHKVAIIGSGPAGYTAALYAARSTLRPLIFKGTAPNIPGGQLMLTSEVENFPGFPKGLLGPELMEKFEEQALRFGAIPLMENINKVDLSKRPFILYNDEQKKYLCETLIIATGANAKLLGLPKEKELMASGLGVSACATCDGAFYKNASVAIVGGGDTAIEEALFLTRYASRVSIIHRRDIFRASKIMIERAQKNPKIFWLLNFEINEIITSNNSSKESLKGLKLKNTIDHTIKDINIDGLFVAIGHKPNVELFKDYLELDERGYIKTPGNSTITNIKGVFACGDVQDSVYRQAVTAAGSGCMAAIDAERFLEHNGL